MNEQKPILASDEIDLIELLQKIWRSRLIIGLTTFIFIIFGIIIALSSKSVFSASSTFIPKGEIQTSLSGRLGGLASLAGINFDSPGSSQSGIPIQLYPRFIKSNPFIKSLLELNVPFEGKTVSFKHYLTLYMKEGILSKIIKFPISIPYLIKSKLMPEEEFLKSNKNLNIIKLTKKEEELYTFVRTDVVSIIIEKKEGFITLNVNLGHPEVAALVTKKAQKLLQNQIIDFKIKNSQEQLAFTEKLFDKKKRLFEALQDKLALYKDQNLNISSGIFRNTVSRLEAEVNVANTVYAELAKQVEEARIQVIKDTPLFTIIDPVIIPNNRISPKRSQIVIIWAFFGLVLSIGYYLLKDPLKAVIRRIQE